MLRNYFLAVVLLALAGCGGDSGPAQTADDTLNRNSPTDNNENGLQDPDAGMEEGAEMPALGEMRAGRSFETDQRDSDRDGIAGLDPIISDAPPTCARPGFNFDDGPDCTSAGTNTYYEESGDTWIDAQVFIPPHREGEQLPVILHSHGWGGSKKSELDELPDCENPQAYDCPIAEGGGLLAMFGQLDSLLSDLYRKGYIIVSFSQRGWGASEGDVMVMNSYHETRDAQAVIDWIARQASQGHLPIALDEAGDFTLGLMGGSYGGGFQLALAAIDERVDTIVPVGTWHSLEQAILPNGGVKGGWGNLLCLLSTGRPRHPFLANACGALTAPFIRQADILNPSGNLLEFVRQNGLSFFADLQLAEQPYLAGEKPFELRPVDAFLIQGTRDVLFNAQAAFDNYRYLRMAGGDVRLMTNQSGHMNPLANQVDGATSCGNVDMFDSIRRWLDVKLRGADEDVLEEIPRLCLSLDDDRGVILDAIPGESSSTDLQMNVDRAWRPFDIRIGNLRGPQKCEVVYEVPSDTTQVLAGIPRLRDFSVQGGIVGGGGAAYLGLCLQRGGQTLLIDDMLTTFAPQFRSFSELVGVGEVLKAGDKVGIMAFKAQEQMNFLTTATLGQVSELLLDTIVPGQGLEETLLGDVLDPLQSLLSAVNTNAYTVRGEIRLPIFAAEAASYRTGAEPPFSEQVDRFNQFPLQ
ncbi:CocE/NonD family hydrolase [Marinobacter salsuginis]|uniref:CocE/NonD family hydrolase n=1 Tax=Marinobacter salsuginis TaxID=418719 RepID=UPI00273F71A4|nr:CocE/NonD family hydrolase [Marinobacter salsuginis]